MIGTLQEETAKLAEVMANASASVTHLACSDVDAIARVLAAAGFEGTAVGLIIDHAGPDDNGEYGDIAQGALHHHIYGPACGIREHGVSQKLLRMARDYVRTL
jgi:hypothetical protein